MALALRGPQIHNVGVPPSAYLLARTSHTLLPKEVSTYWHTGVPQHHNPPGMGDFSEGVSTGISKWTNNITKCSVMVEVLCAGPSNMAAIVANATSAVCEPSFARC